MLIWAKPHASTGTTTFSMELRAVGAGKSRRWLVDYFEPIGGGLSQPTNPNPNPLQAASGPEPERDEGQLGVAWVLVPLSVLALIVLIPIALAIRGWRRNRRADRDYSRTLPPLPLHHLDVDLEAVGRELEAVLERPLRRAVRDQEPLGPRCLERLERLDGAEVAARCRLRGSVEQRGLADEEVGVARDVREVALGPESPE